MFFLALGAFATPHAAAVITRLTPLKSVIDDSDLVAAATVESIDPARPSMTLTLGEALKGEAKAKSMAVLLKGDSEGNPRQVLDRVKAGATLIVFITELPDRHMALAYSEGSWFQIIGQLVDGSPRWAFTHGEPYLRRTFKGTTEEMKQTVAAYIKEKKEPPAVSASEKPGLGATLPGVVAEPEPTPAKDGGATAKDAGNDDSGKSEANKNTGTAPSPAAPSAPSDVKNESLQPWLLIGGAAAAVFVLVLLLRKKGG